jgi:hypothetical protein
MAARPAFGATLDSISTNSTLVFPTDELTRNPSCERCVTVVPLLRSRRLRMTLKQRSGRAFETTKIGFAGVKASHWRYDAKVELTVCELTGSLDSTTSQGACRSLFCRRVSSPARSLTVRCRLSSISSIPPSQPYGRNESPTLKVSADTLNPIL